MIRSNEVPHAPSRDLGQSGHLLHCATEHIVAHLSRRLIGELIVIVTNPVSGNHAHPPRVV